MSRHVLPPDLPAPVDDGACDHLPGSRVPSVRLASTAGGWVDVAEIAAPPTVLFFYPRTGEPDRPAGRNRRLTPPASRST